jgi:ABC-type amino acid transport substrate-binding protein
VALFAAALLSGAARAECAAADRPDADILVAVRDAAPFTYLDDGLWQGLAVDIWNRVNLSLGTALDLPIGGSGRSEPPVIGWVACDSIDEQEAAMRAGRVDVVISPLTITSERLRSYDFSQQYLASGLALALPRSDAIDFAQATRILRQTLFQPTVAQAVVLFLGFNLVMAFFIRRLLMREEPLGPWHPRPVLEAVIRTIGLRGVGDGYTSAAAKVLEIFMAIVGTALSATILGVLTTSFVGSVGEGRRIGPQEMTGMRIATLKCSTAQAYLAEQYAALGREMAEDDPLRPVLAARLDWLACPEGAPIAGPAEMSEPTGLAGAVILTGSWPAAAQLLADGEVDAVLGDWIGLTYASRTDRFAGLIEVQKEVYRNEPYGWAIARGPGSDRLRQAIDEGLIAQIRDVGWRPRLERHLGAGSVSPN